MPDAEKVALLTRPTQARRDAPFPMLRSQLIEILNVPQRDPPAGLVRGTACPRAESLSWCRLRAGG